MIKKFAPYTFFDTTLPVLVKTMEYPWKEFDNPPKDKWDKELWIERAEDWYALSSLKGKVVRIVERNMWLYAVRENEKKGINLNG
jgi:hypothetical protein